MKVVKVTLLALSASLLLAACGGQAIVRDAQYQMGDFAETKNGEFGVSSTEVVENEDGKTIVQANLAVVNTTASILRVEDLYLSYYSPVSEEYDYVSVDSEAEAYLLPGGYSLATIEFDYSIDGTYYLSFDDVDDNEMLYAIEVKKDEVVEKALPEVVNTANADLATNVQKGVASGLGDLEFTFGDTETYTWQTNIGGMSNEFVKSGVSLTIKNTGSSSVDLSEYRFYELYTFTDNTVDFSTVATQLGSDTDDVTEIGEVSTIKAGESVEVVLMLDKSYSDKDIFGHYIQIVLGEEKITYKL